MERNEVVIKAGKSALNYWREVWRQRELFLILGKRDVMVRYKQTVLGVAWGVIRPLMTAMVMVFAFGKIAKLEQDSSIPYMLVVIPGVIIWLFFSQSLSQISNSIVGNGNLVSKVYFPRIIIPFSSLLVGWQIFLAPIFLILAYLAAFGSGLFAS
eukprot:gene32328-54793_t